MQEQHQSCLCRHIYMRRMDRNMRVRMVPVQFNGIRFWSLQNISSLVFHIIPGIIQVIVPPDDASQHARGLRVAFGFGGAPRHLLWAGLHAILDRQVQHLSFWRPRLGSCLGQKRTTRLHTLRRSVRIWGTATHMRARLVPSSAICSRKTRAA